MTVLFGKNTVIIHILQKRNLKQKELAQSHTAKRGVKFGMFDSKAFSLKSIVILLK